MSGTRTGLERLATKVRRKLAHHGKSDALRSLEPNWPGKWPIDLTSNDYLQLRNSPRLRQAWQAAAAHLPLGGGASRLLGGEHPIFGEAEAAFAAFRQAESALFFSSGYAANLALLSSLAQLGASFYCDRLNHASIMDGLRIIRTQRVQTFEHGSYDTLERMLGQDQRELKVVVVESLYSMDGDTTRLDRLEELAEAYEVVVIVDEAHALGCFGTQGEGLVPTRLSRDWITVYPCGKAFGLQGAFICGPQWLREYLINAGRTFIYSTAPSPVLLACLKEVTTWIPSLGQERARLKQLGDTMRNFLHAQGCNIGDSESHIVPLILGESRRAVEAARLLEQHGIFCRPVRPPTVPKGQARLRLSLHCGLSPSDEAELQRVLSIVLKEID